MYSTDGIDDQVTTLRQQIQNAESQLRELKVQLEQAETQAQAARHLNQAYEGGFPQDWITETLAALSQGYDKDESPEVTSMDTEETIGTRTSKRWPLTGEEYKRYGRQLIMPEIGLQGQLRLKQSGVLIVGVGGLGCPAAAYLAGAGVGRIGLVDGDTVEVSNLHRQIAHATGTVGMSKVESAVEYLSSLNPTVRYMSHEAHMTPQSAITIVEQYDFVLDCTDHPTSRYLISDACVLTGRPLVSASALKTEGQLIVLNNPPSRPGDMSGGPCYRCVFPKPPPAESVVSCGEGGILGPVVGVMGVLQALETIKLVAAAPQPPETVDGDVEMSNGQAEEATKPTLLMFSAYANPQFRSVRLRSRRKDCAACSGQASITKESLTSGSLDYVAFCGVTAPISILKPKDRVSATAFEKLSKDTHPLVVDVRDRAQYELCSLPGSINIPWTGSGEAWGHAALQEGKVPEDSPEVYVICKLGNDSQLAARILQDHGTMLNVKDVEGGFRAWKQEVDPEWPDY